MRTRQRWIGSAFVSFLAACSADAQATAQRARQAAATSRPAAAPVRVIELRGDGAALGEAHGRQLGKTIQPLFRGYFEKFFGSATERQQAMTAAAGFERYLLPEHRQEIEALAVSSGMSPAEAMLAQSFLDLMPAMGCSTIALSAAAAPDGVARFGRNLDFESFNIADRHSILLVFHPKDRYAFAAVTWPGMIGVLSGMNEHGMTLANMEVARRPRAPQAMPYTLLYRMLLERCKTVKEAITLLEQTPRQSANNLMLMDASGDRAVAELTPEGITVRRAAAAKALISTNHQRGQDLDSRGRCRRFDSLHAAAGREFGQITEASLERMLAGAAAGDMTLQSMIFEPANRILYLAAGANAAARQFRRIELKTLFEKTQ